MLTLECALTVDIPIVDGFDEDITAEGAKRRRCRDQ